MKAWMKLVPPSCPDQWEGPFPRWTGHGSQMDQDQDLGLLSNSLPKPEATCRPPDPLG